MLRPPGSRAPSAWPGSADASARCSSRWPTGRSNPAIGQILFLSVSAVEKHVSAIFTKLGLVEEPSSSRRVAAVLAYLADG